MKRNIHSSVKGSQDRQGVLDLLGGLGSPSAQSQREKCMFIVVGNDLDENIGFHVYMAQAPQCRVKTRFDGD